MVRNPAPMAAADGDVAGNGSSTERKAETRAHSAPDAPPPLAGLEDAGVSRELIADLLLKVLFVQGTGTGEAVSDALRLPFALLDDLLLDLQQRRIIAVRGTNGSARSSYVFDLTSEGRDRAREALDASQYVGPVPVPLDQYRQRVEAQSIRHVHVDAAKVREGFGDLVMDEELLATLGPAVNSAKSLFIFGDSGNGKTMIADAIARMLGGSIYVPHALEVEGRIIVVHDPVYHKPARPEGNAGDDVSSLLWRAEAGYDRRYAQVRRPVVVTGGELTLDQLDLQYDPFTKMYQAPFQVKANGGVLIVDDFGRQRVPPRDLLNRWIVPLEKRLDYLTLHTGGKFPVPFDSLLLLATNLDPTDLVEEAFLRRIHYKIRVGSPGKGAYREIFRRCCASRGIDFSEDAFAYLWDACYVHRPHAPRGCHPRDLLDHVVDAARYSGVPPALSDRLIDYAVATYFIDLSAAGDATAADMPDGATDELS